MTKKQTSKLLNFLPNFRVYNLISGLTRKATKNSKRIVFTFLLAVLFLPVVIIGSDVPNIAHAQQSGGAQLQQSGGCDLTSLNRSNATGDYSFQPSDSNAILHADQRFQLGIKIINITNSDLAQACYSANSNIQIRLNIKLYSCPILGPCIIGGPGYAPLGEGNLSAPARQISDSDGNVIGIGGLFQQTTARQIIRDSNGGQPTYVLESPFNSLYLYFYPSFFISDSNFTPIPLGDSTGFNRETTTQGQPGPPGVVPPDFAPAVQGTSEDRSGPGAVGALFNFLRETISFTVLIITTIIYYIFSVILVPLIVALLQIHPYEDKFVNFIYPGWIILRNISNIFFIVALLWIGLRTIFQLDDAAKSRSFIVRLILMALLVNFSLVIGQAIVGIADTVQAQFLPANTRVVEALGHKLMVDPIQTFRGDSSTQDAFLSDLPKSIVLLVLAVASFFAFVALIAFLIIRLAALWILYMLSPLAYVGQILPQTRSQAEKWWREFIKYAFAVPIMAFFLNISALMAVSFSGQRGDVVQVDGSGSTTLWGTLNVGVIGAEVVEYTVTVMSHFIVIVFLFMGMHFALKFGGAGAEKIVDGAKTGFKKAFEWPYKGAKAGLGLAKDGLGLAKDAAGDALSQRYKTSKPNLAAAISAATRPVATGKMLRDRLWTQPKKKQTERLEETRKPLDKFADNVGNNKILAAKMLAYKAAGNSAKAMEARAALYGNIMTDEERQHSKDQIKEKQNRLADISTYGSSWAVAKTVSKADAEIYQQEMQKRLDDVDAREQAVLQPLEEKRSRALALNKTDEAKKLLDEINDTKANYAGQRKRFEADKNIIDTALAGKEGSPPNTAISLPTSADVSKVLAVSTETLNLEAANIQTKLDTDDAVRKERKITKYTEEDRARDVSGITAVAATRQFGGIHDFAARAERLSNENESVKKYDGVDDAETLSAAFKSAIAKNNTDLASAIAKKMAKEGNFKDLLAAEGYKNNLEDFKRFMAEKFKQAPIVVRNQVATELSNINMQNGNRALGKATTVNSEGVISWHTIEQQQEKLSKTASKQKVWEKKPSEIFYEDSSGKNKFITGEEEEIHKIANNRKALDRIEDRMSSKTATELLKAHEAGETKQPFHINIVNSLKKVAGRS
ncbi:MAG TPA: type IV secretion system protein [Candidatus Doudnabacteria bacterium]|nr:type IV secretion system protein [Candidatus Doudnabacteria bacterium]